MKILHCHVFKNAGTTFDAILKREFGNQFIDHRDDGFFRCPAGTANLKALIAKNNFKALSSHHLPMPFAAFDTVTVFFVRHPLLRAKSVYQFERMQNAQTPGTIKAKEMSFPEFMEWSLHPDIESTLKNGQVKLLTSANNNLYTCPQKLLDTLIQNPAYIFGVVEEFDKSMVLFASILEAHFPKLNLTYSVPCNTTSKHDYNSDEALESIRSKLGERLYNKFVTLNQVDFYLYNTLKVEFERRYAITDPSGKHFHAFQKNRKNPEAFSRSLHAFSRKLVRHYKPSSNNL